jgi:hypothetical protein
VNGLATAQGIATKIASSATLTEVV